MFHADAFDVFVTKKIRVRLLDINPAYGTTQALLFSWDELTERATGLRAAAHACDSNDARGSDSGQQGEDCELRTVQDPMHIQTSTKCICGAPVDTLDMPGMSWPGILDVLQKQCRLQEHDADEE